MKCVVITKTFKGKVFSSTQEQTFPLDAFKIFGVCGWLENRVLRRLFGPKRDEVTGTGESCITRS
jgi:hypothetical protein